LDAGGRRLGSLFQAPEGTISFDLNDAAEELLAHYGYADAAKGLVLYGSSRFKESSVKASIGVLMVSEPDFALFTPDGKYYSTQSKGFHRSSGTLDTIYWIGKELSKDAYHKVVPEKPEHDIESIIPSEDLRLVDRRGHVFAVLGLSQAAEPSMLLLDQEGKLMVVWSLSRPGPFDSEAAPQWPTLQLFDRHGAMRVQVELGPEPSPVLTIFERASSSADLGIYVLDPQTGEEVPKQKLFAGREGAIPWLKHSMSKASLPIRLVDERAQVLWKSPS
jgi:hypothetical protein